MHKQADKVRADVTFVEIETAGSAIKKGISVKGELSMTKADVVKMIVNGNFTFIFLAASCPFLIGILMSIKMRSI